MVPAQRHGACPSWCALRHGQHAGEEDAVHLSSPLFVRSLLVRLCATVDPANGDQDGPYLLLGQEELRLEEAHQLVKVLMDLLAEARRISPRAAAGTRSPGP